MFSKTKLIGLSLGISSSVLLFAAATAQVKGKSSPNAAMQVRFDKEVQGFVGKFCVGCHTGKDAAAGINLAGKHSIVALTKNRDSWSKVAHNVESSAMPPAGSPMPTQKERDLLGACIEAIQSQADCSLNDPGRVTMRRLNREEYNNTVRDLFGIDFRPADSFPSDDVGYGFDNVGDVLSISPLLMEKYLTAAEKISQAVIATPESRVQSQKFDLAKLSHSTGSNGMLQTNGCLLYTSPSPRD